jgi:hypothetical protein
MDNLTMYYDFVSFNELKESVDIARYKNINYIEYRTMINEATLYFLRLFSSNKNKKRFTFIGNGNNTVADKNVFNYKHTVQSIKSNEATKEYIFSLWSVHKITNELIKIQFKASIDNKFFLGHFKKLIIRTVYDSQIDEVIEKFLLSDLYVEATIVDFHSASEVICSVVLDGVDSEILRNILLRVDVGSIENYERGNTVFFYKPFLKIAASVLKESIVKNLKEDKRYIIDRAFQINHKLLRTKKSIQLFLDFYYFKINGRVPYKKNGKTLRKRFCKGKIRYDKKFNLYYLEDTSPIFFKMFKEKVFIFFEINLKTKKEISNLHLGV